MTACASRLQHLSYVAEAAWAEASTSMAGAQQIPHTGVVDVSGLKRALIEAGRAQQYKNAIDKRVAGAWSDARFTFRVEITGHGSATNGAITISELENLLGWAIGGVVRTATVGHTFDAGSTETALVLDAAPAAPGVGGLFRAGQKKDTRADGQWGVVETFAGVNLASEVALPAAPANDDVFYPAVNIYTVESTCVVTSKRFALKTADECWVVHGGFAESVKLMGGNAGELLMAEITVRVSWAEQVNVTFPDTTTTAAWTYNGAPNAAGGIFMNDYGTATRQILACRSLSIDLSLGVRPLISHAGVDGAQIITGASRTQDICKVELVIDAVGASATPTWLNKALAGTPQHLLAGYSVGNGTAAACRLGYLVWDTETPVQVANDDLNRLVLKLQAGTDVAETDELSRSMFKLGLT
jgi:hypothetical protein